jgi:hypothetical protein
MVKKKRSKVSREPHDVDPLGKTINCYAVSLAGALIVSGIGGVVGLGLTGYGLAQDPMSVLFLAIGALFAVLALLWLGVNLLNLGRRLEVRKNGIRFVEAGDQTELLWEDIADIQVNRTDNTYMGVVSVQTKSSNYVPPSGPLTKTDWDVTIRARDGRTIRLRPTFLKLVPDVRKLITHMRMRAGL